MKQVISTIIIVLFCLPLSAQQVVKLLEPAYADSADVYRQSVYVPQKWDGSRVVLSIERPLGATRVRVNGKEAGGDSAVAVPHRFDVTRYIDAGKRNTIEIKVAGHDSRGMLGDVELRAQPSNLFINKVNLHPRPFNRAVGVELDLLGDTPDMGFYGIQFMVQREDVDSANLYVSNHDIWANHMECEVSILDRNLLWDEFHPNCYRLAISAGDDYQEITFGMREAGVVDGQLFLNRHPVYLRGAVIDDYFPLWGRMPTDQATWERVFRRLEELGLNHVRFNGYCPTDAAFCAADKVGFYLQPEAKSKFEMGRIADVYGHHPSLVLMSIGDSTYVWNDGYIVPVRLNPSVIYGADVMQYKLGVEQRLLNDSCGHYLLGGLCDRRGDLSGVLRGLFTDKESGLIARDFSEFCRPIVPLARLDKTTFSVQDTLRVPVDVYNAMYGHLQGVRTSYYLHTDSGRVLAGGLVASGEIPLAPDNRVGEIVFPLDSVPADCKRLTLTLTVGASSVRNHWDLIINQ